MLKIVIYTNEPVLALGLQSLVSALGGFEPAATYEVWERLLLEAAQFDRDYLVIVDLTAAATLNKLTELMTTAGGARVVLWTEALSAEFLSQAMQLGVRGIIRKCAALESYTQCLSAVASGQIWVDTYLADRVNALKRMMLSPRERELMGLLAQGLSNKELAMAMKIAQGTVKQYLTHLYAKVGARDRFELALIALKNLAGDQTDTPRHDNTDPSGGTLAMPRYLSVDKSRVQEKKGARAAGRTSNP